MRDLQFTVAVIHDCYNFILCWRYSMFTQIPHTAIFIALLRKTRLKIILKANSDNNYQCG